ncbi:bifunctional folylpolyglutamate synthase/dihydrofolate synthase [Aestuariimicrobium sp. p3-SID1156]|uniref:bifunctional folylpolyglutamate synthase/dihydrofolate synthase n=1 Tax=Aestuariimicrobium sp. p3-SID1156 TaxID=2916038 RepID=UPI00223BA97D|nr:folylpolyglutamate synthase/dihydrofolate synthase family protein [Aestuariimicrobium sp. p3-SID1156]MCT1459182.1 bifunctional folylpolyglutamate synthase/dihydrofolate synthase [Aestuariimicrobium sp. p3-SID1156]
MANTPTHTELVAQLQARWPEHRIGPGLARVRALCDLLGNPERSAPVIQVTGTNGKGSTAIVIDALLRAQGLRTGRTASPHLTDVTERICIDGEPIAPQTFDEIWAQVEPMVRMVDEQQIDGIPMTFFEVITGMAFAAFADAPVDVIILEVGMGGTWDASNVADAQVAVITPIDLDHTNHLGTTIAAIATEKAGIIKPDATAVIAGQQPEAARVLMERCAEVGAMPVLEGPGFGLFERQRAVGGQVLRINTAGGPVGDLHLPLHGEHMAANAAQAVAAVEAFLGGHPLEAEVISDAFSALEAPARLELMRTSPSVVVDTAHNPHGVRATLAAAEEAYGFQPLIGVVAMMRDKDIDTVLDLLSQTLDRIVVTTVSSTDRGMPVAELVEVAEGIFGTARVDSAPTMDQALELALSIADQTGASAGVLVIGSVIAAGEARAILLPGKLREQAEAAHDSILRVGPTRADVPSLSESESDW